SLLFVFVPPPTSPLFPYTTLFRSDVGLRLFLLGQDGPGRASHPLVVLGRCRPNHRFGDSRLRWAVRSGSTASDCASRTGRPRMSQTYDFGISFPGSMKGLFTMTA